MEHASMGGLPPHSPPFHLWNQAISGWHGAHDAHAEAFLEELPVLTEADITALGQDDASCPICFLSLLAVIAEEEMADAMGSPAHASSELGVTRLHKTCGHVFCRKDLTKWVREGKRSCPMCRTPFLPSATGDVTADATTAAGDDEAPEPELPSLSLGVVLSQLVRRTQLEMDRAEVAQDEDDRREFAGMYS